MKHVLVCLSSSPSNAKTIEGAYKLVKATSSSFRAVYVETSTPLTPENQARLRENCRMAEKFGASLEVLYGEDIPSEISKYVQYTGISDVVIGKSTLRSKNPLKKTLMDRLLVSCPNVEFHVVPDYTGHNTSIKTNTKRPNTPLQDVFRALSILVLTTLVGYLFESMGFTKENIITIYILSVLVTSIITNDKKFSWITSIIAVIVFNFCFTYPKYTLFVYEPGYPVTFLVMFVASFMTGTLATQLKNIAQQSSLRAYRTNVLLDTDQAFTKTHNKEEAIEVLGSHLVKLLDKDVAIYDVQEEQLGKSYFFPSKEAIIENVFDEEIVSWVYTNNHHAGYGSTNYTSAPCLYYSIRIQNKVYGVVGIHIDQEPLEAFEVDLLVAILQECALTMDNFFIQKEKEEAAILAQKEKVRANMLRGISHDLRTPLTSISGNANILMSNGEYLNEETKQGLYKSIYEDSIWLNNMVENLLSVSRIEEGRINVTFRPELVEELLEEAVHHTLPYKGNQTLSIEMENPYLLIKADSTLILQLLNNLLDNAIKYAGDSAHIRLRGYESEEYACIEIVDDGPGILKEDMEHIFETFYVGQNKIIDSNRSLGLGLALCKNIVDLHSGKITVEDNIPHGAKFKIELPLEKVEIYE